MSDTSVPECAVCGAPSKWFCAFCQSSFFCHEHACNHLARQYPDEFGIKPGPKDIESTHPKFRTSVTPEELWGPRFKPDPPKEPKGVGRLITAVLVGLVLGIVACVLENSGAYFLPVFGVIMLLFCLELIFKKSR